MELSTRIDSEACIILLDGDLDAASSILVDKALEAVLQRDQNYILVNFNSLNYISAAGIGVFIAHIKRIKDQRKVIVLYNMSLQVRNVFSLTGLDEIIPIVSNEEEAQGLCKQRACN